MVDVHPDPTNLALIDLHLVQMRGRVGVSLGEPQLCCQKYEPKPSLTAQSMVLELAYTPVRWCPITDSQDRRYGTIWFLYCSYDGLSSIEA